MSKENMFYTDKSDVYVAHEDDVWDGAYAEVAYEENVEDNSQINLSYNSVEQCSVMSDVYETAGEDNTQYFSMIDNSVNSSLLSDDDTINNSHVNIDSHNSTLISQFPSEVEDKNEPVEEVKEAESEDQVILYRKEGSDELYAVQIARDSDGNVQKYQYQVRQSEDGQLEAVPGTIRLQPEGTEQLICDDSESQDEPCPPSNKTIEEELTPKIEPTEIYQPKSSPPALAPITNSSKTKNDNEAYFNSQIMDDEEFTNVEYLQEDLEEVAATVNLLSQKSSPGRFTAPVKASPESIKRPKIKANIVSIRHENDQPKSLLKSNFIFDNENIKYKPIPSPASQKGNKLTYLIMTQPTKRLVPPSTRPVQHFASVKKFRSILRPSVGAAKTNSPVIRSFCKAITEESPMKMFQKKTSTEKLVPNEKPLVPVIENRVQRQPRKQIITPVDRDGSEIIIHTPVDTDVMETYDLDSLSDEEKDSSKIVKTRRRTPKKKGRKPNVKLVENIKLNDQSQSFVPEPKRGPGRRKKSVDIEKKDLENKTAEDDIGAKGRKSRVNDSVITSSENDEELTSGTLKRKSSEPEIEVPRRKRGRPRRKPIVEDDSVKSPDKDSDIKTLEDEIENMFGFTSDDDLKNDKPPPIDDQEKPPGDNKEDVLLLALKGAEIIEDFENNDPKDSTETKHVDTKKNSLRSRRTISHSVSDADQKDGGIYKCVKCSETFSQFLTYKEHLKTHVTIKAVGGNSCPVCKRSFTSQKLLIQHKLSHADSITYRKPEDQSNDLRRLRPSTQTKTEVSEMISRNTKEVDPVEKSYSCQVCSKEFRQLAHLVMHREIHNKYSCTECTKTFSLKHLLDEHQKRNCKEMKKVSSLVTKKMFTCDTCKKQFINNLFYKNHLKSHEVKVKEPASGRPSEKATVQNGSGKLVVGRHSIRKQVPSAKANAFQCGNCKQSFITYTGLVKHACVKTKSSKPLKIVK